jgi:hypothetical protein
MIPESFGERGFFAEKQQSGRKKGTSTSVM